MSHGRAPLWIVKDRWQRDIMLYEDTWFDHIAYGHPELRGYDAAVAKVLEKPYRVMHDAVIADRECYYAQIRQVFPGFLIKVCVEFPADEPGFVVTAFLIPGIRADEVQRWP